MRFSRTVVRIERVVLVLAGVSLLIVDAAPRRGTIETYAFKDSIDFSAINDSCQKRTASTGGSWSFNGCVMAIPDIRMTQNHVDAAYGILDLGKCTDTGCIGTLQSVPTSGYLDTVDFSYAKLGHLFAIRTSEMNYALLYYRGMGSGLPFNDFRWAYQPDGTPNFNKDSVSGVRSGFLMQVQPNSVTLKAVYKGISYRVLEAGRIRIDLFDARGKCVSLIADHFYGAGEYFIDLHDKPYSPGVYLFKCSRRGTVNRDEVIPYVLR